MKGNNQDLQKAINELNRRLAHLGYQVKEVFYRNGKPCFLIGESNDSLQQKSG